jgi:5-methylcytosine-specific restriction endonuclease McrA
MGRFARLAEQMGDIQRLAWEEVWLYADDCSEIIRNMPHHRRRRVAAALIAEMLDAQGGICPLCNKIIDKSTLGAFHVDHVIPFSKGGGYESENLQVTHPACNRWKGDFVEYYDLVPYLERKAEELDR